MANKKKISIVSMLTITGAFISYTIGSGFASGNEVLQFFGSWGLAGSVLSVLGAALITFISCLCAYNIGAKVNFETTSQAYTYIGGKYLGGFFQIWTFVSLFGTFMIMFSGAGALFNQFWDLPTWVGTVALGVVSGVVVVGGLDTVEKVLGSAGILILFYVLVFGVISLFNPGSDIGQASEVTQLVDEGVVYQANLFALPPLSWIPGLEELNTPFIEGMLYAALCFINGIPFFLALGKKTNNLGEATGSSLMTTIGFYACVAFVLIIIMANFNSIIDTSSNEMAPFPVLSAVDYIWPSGSWTYVIIIFIGIFTTTTGFLYVIQEWLFPKQVRTKKTNTFIVLMVLAGIFLGSVLPFSQLINFIFPLSGFVGLIATVCMIVKIVKLNRKAVGNDDDTLGGAADTTN